MRNAITAILTVTFLLAMIPCVTGCNRIPVTGRGAICLPSTSPANAAWSIDRLVDAWSVIRT